MQSEDSGLIDAALASAQFWLAPILALAISGIYFVTSPPSQPLIGRLAASSHGAVIAVIYVGALIIRSTGASKPFVATLFLPVALIGASFFLYEGRKSLHFLHFVNLLCLAWTYFIGSMAITGKWL